MRRTDRMHRSMATIKLNIIFKKEYGDSKRAQALYDLDSDDEEEEKIDPNPKLVQGEECVWISMIATIYYAGNKLPRRYGEFPLEMAHTPIVDIDPYYADKKTFMVINKEGTINRFAKCHSDIVF